MAAKFDLFVDEDHSTLPTFSYTGYQNFIKYLITHVFLLILVHVCTTAELLLLKPCY